MKLKFLFCLFLITSLFGNEATPKELLQASIEKWQNFAQEIDQTNIAKEDNYSLSSQKEILKQTNAIIAEMELALKQDDESIVRIIELSNSMAPRINILHDELNLALKIHAVKQEVSKSGQAELLNDISQLPKRNSQLRELKLKTIDELNSINSILLKTYNTAKSLNDKDALLRDKDSEIKALKEEIEKLKK